MIKINPNISLKPKSWSFTALCLLLFVLCLVLSVWQFHRYHAKQQLLQNYATRLIASPKSLEQVTQEKDIQFQPLQVTGHYLNELTILIQNKFYRSQLGFEVLTPLQIPGDHKLLLIDRGWVAKPLDKTLPDIVPVSVQQHLQGYIKLVNEYQFTLGKNVLQPYVHPWVMQKIDLAEIANLSKQTFYPFILRLNAHESSGFVRDWTITTMTPARHLMYAIQWLLLAVVIVIAYIFFCAKSDKHE